MSVLRGYEASKGFIFLSIAFFIGSCTVSIPGQDELDVYSLKVEDMNVLYGFQLLVHFLTTVQSILSINLDKWKHMELLSEGLGRLTVLLMIVIYMWQWRTFLTLGNNFDPESGQKFLRPKDIEDFQFWITLEILLLLAIAITNFIFLFTRSFIVPAFDLDTKEWYEQ